MLYQLFNTNFHEIQAAKQMKLSKKEIRKTVVEMEADVRQVMEEQPTAAEKQYL